MFAVFCNDLQKAWIMPAVVLVDFHMLMSVQRLYGSTLLNQRAWLRPGCLGSIVKPISTKFDGARELVV